jgi:hypothetical protein
MVEDFQVNISKSTLELQVLLLLLFLLVENYSTRLDDFGTLGCIQTNSDNHDVWQEQRYCDFKKD